MAGSVVDAVVVDGCCDAIVEVVVIGAGASDQDISFVELIGASQPELVT